jgi:hypothetical protein
MPQKNAVSVLPSLPDYVIYTQLKLPTSSLARCHLLLVLYRRHATLLVVFLCFDSNPQLSCSAGNETTRQHIEIVYRSQC